MWCHKRKERIMSKQRLLRIIKDRKRGEPQPSTSKWNLVQTEIEIEIRETKKFGAISENGSETFSV